MIFGTYEFEIISLAEGKAWEDECKNGMISTLRFQVGIHDAFTL